MDDFFFNDTATTEIYTLSLHDALPICLKVTSLYPRTKLKKIYRNTKIASTQEGKLSQCLASNQRTPGVWRGRKTRSEEHTSELQSRQYLVCRLLLEKKNDTSQSRENC